MINLIRKKDYDLTHKPEQIGFAFNNFNSTKKSKKSISIYIGLAIIIFGFLSALILGLIPLYLSKNFQVISYT